MRGHKYPTESLGREYELTIARHWDRVNTLNMMTVRVVERTRERRAEPRYRVNEFSVLKSTGDIAAVRVLDISAIGLRVASVAPLPVNTPVQVQLDGATVSGLVKNCCCLRVAEFQLGILAGPQILPTRLDHLSILRRAKRANQEL